jgi:hypothetical protein
VKRRESTGEGSLPKKLARFSDDDWEGRDAAERYSAWMAARSAYGDKQGWVEVPGDVAAWAAFPDGTFRKGDV